MSRLLEYGAIHGRFQPFHTGHLTYLRHALRLADTVAVGVTTPHPHLNQVVEPTDVQRHLTANNPFTFFERLQMITAAVSNLEDAGGRVLVVPFDISADPRLYPYFVPLRFTQFVSPHEPWDTEKIRRFRSAGYSVQEIPTETGRVTATAVRSALVAGGDTWQTMVPTGVAAVLESFNARGRLAAADRKEAHPT